MKTNQDDVVEHVYVVIEVYFDGAEVVSVHRTLNSAMRSQQREKWSLDSKSETETWWSESGDYTIERKTLL